MIFKNYKVLIDNIVDPVSDKSLRGHQAEWQNAETKAVSAFFGTSRNTGAWNLGKVLNLRHEY